MSTRTERRRRGAAMVSAIVILLFVAVFAAIVLSMHHAHVSTAELGMHRARAQAAAIGGLQLAAWRVHNDADLKSALTQVVAAGDTSYDEEALFRFSGGLVNGAFNVYLWPGEGVLRLRADGVAGPARVQHWTQVPYSAATGGIWFDETRGGQGYGTFGELAAAYAAYIGTPDATIDFTDLRNYEKLGTQYKRRYGVTFKHTSGGPFSSYSGANVEGGANVEDLTGYDGTYMPHGDRVYLRFDNDSSSAPFTIVFDEPVSSVSAFIATGVEGAAHDVQITLYDERGNVIDQHVTATELWDAHPYRQNYESFFAARLDEPRIRRVEILNLSHTYFANALVIDNIAFSR